MGTGAGEAPLLLANRALDIVRHDEVASTIPSGA
jgi:hypothetical protein